MQGEGEGGTMQGRNVLGIQLLHRVSDAINKGTLLTRICENLIN